MQVEKRVS
jgi:hypothetical protein